MYDVDKLKEQRAKLGHDMNEMVEALNKKNAEHRDKNEPVEDFSPEDMQKFDAMQKDFDGLKSEIEKQERLNGYSNVVNSISSDLEKPEPRKTPTPANYVSSTRPKLVDSDEYRKAWLDSLRFNKPMGMEYRELAQSGTYTVPTYYANELAKCVEDNSVMDQLCKHLSVGGTINFPTVTARPTPTFTAESGAAADSDATFAQVTIEQHKLSNISWVTHETIWNTTFDLGAELVSMQGEALAALREYWFLVGDGTNDAYGVLDSTYGGSGAMTTASNTITVPEAIELQGDVRQKYRKNGTYLCSDATLIHLRTRTATTGEILWGWNGQTNFETFANRPIVTSDQFPEISDGSGTIVMAFGDFGYYRITDHPVGYLFQRLDEVKADEGLIGFLAYGFAGGRLLLREAVALMTLGTS